MLLVAALVFAATCKSAPRAPLLAALMLPPLARSMQELLLPSVLPVACTGALQVEPTVGQPTVAHSVANALILSCEAGASGAALATAAPLPCDRTCAAVCCSVTSWSRALAAEIAFHSALGSSRFLLFEALSAVAADATEAACVRACPPEALVSVGAALRRSFSVLVPRGRALSVSTSGVPAQVPKKSVSDRSLLLSEKALVVFLLALH
jgi:hypothetical protein